MTSLNGLANRLGAPAERTDLFDPNLNSTRGFDDQHRAEQKLDAAEEVRQSFRTSASIEDRSSEQTSEIAREFVKILNEMENEMLHDFLNHVRKERKATEVRVHKALLHLEAETFANAIQCASEVRRRLMIEASELTDRGSPLTQFKKKLQKVAERQGIAFKKAIRLLDRLSIDLLTFRFDPDSRSTRRFTRKTSMVAKVGIWRESEVPTFTSLRFRQDDLFFSRESGSRKGIWMKQDPLRTNQIPSQCSDLLDVRDFCFVKNQGCVIVQLISVRVRGKTTEYHADLLTYDCNMVKKCGQIKLRGSVGENERFSVVGRKTDDILVVDHTQGLLIIYKSFSSLVEISRVRLQKGINGFDWKSECDNGMLTYLDRALILNSNLWPRTRIARPGIDSTFEHCAISKYPFCLIEEQCRMPVKLTVIRTFSFSGVQLRTIRWPQNNNWSPIETLITTRESLRGWTLVDKDDGFFMVLETYDTKKGGVELKYVRMQTQSQRHMIEIDQERGHKLQQEQTQTLDQRKKQNQWTRKRKRLGKSKGKKEEREWKWTENSQNVNDRIAITDCFPIPNSKQASAIIAYAESDVKLFLLDPATNCIMMADKGLQRDAADISNLVIEPFIQETVENITGMCMLKKRTLIVILSNSIIRTYPDVNSPQQSYTNRISSTNKAHLRDENAFAFTMHDGRLFVAVRQSDRVLELKRFNDINWHVRCIHKLTSEVSVRCFYYDDRTGKFLIVCVNEKKRTYRAMVLDGSLNEECSLPLSPSRNESQWFEPLVGLLSGPCCLLSFRIPGEGCRTLLYNLRQRTACYVRESTEMVSAYVPLLPVGRVDDSLTTLIFCGFAKSVTGLHVMTVLY